MEKTQKSKGKTYLQPFSAKIMLVCIVMLMTISLISAYSFDNKKEVKETFGKAGYKDLKIGNFYGLGKDLWSGTLDSNTKSCGTNCEAIQTITLHEKGNLVDDVIFKTKQEDGSWIEQGIRSYDILIHTDSEPYEVDDYETVCEYGEPYLNGNGTYTTPQTCEQVLVGTHTEYTAEWQSYELGTELKKGTYEVKLVGEKKPSRTVDWIYETQGVQLDEWAEWSASATVIYDNFDTSPINNSLWTNTTLIATSLVVNTEDDAPASNHHRFMQTDANADRGIKQMVSNNFPSLSDINMIRNLTINYSVAGRSAYGKGIVVVFGEEVLSEMSSVFPTYDNYIIDLIKNQTQFDVYVNNVYSETFTATNNIINITLDANPTGDTVTAFHDLVNFVKYELLNGTIVLNSPADAYISTTNNVQFNATATVTGGATLTNMSLWHNGTGTWARNQTTDFGNGISANWSTGDASGLVVASDFWGAQSFTAGHTDNNIMINKIGILIKRAGSSGILQTRLYLADATGKPTGSALSTNSTTDTSAWSTSLTWQNITMPEYNLVDGTNYTIVINLSTANPDGLEWDKASGYNYGQEFRSTDNGASWSYTGSGQHTFAVYGGQPTTSTQTFTTTITEPTLWGIEACDSDGDCGFSTTNRTVLVDTSPPTITINKPTTLTNFGAIDVNETLNWTITDTNLDSIWWEYNSINTTVYGAANETNFTLTAGDYNGTLWANDSVGNVNSTTINWLYKIFQNNETYNTTTFETASETYKINVTTNTSLTGANLIYDGTSYAATQSGTVWSRTLDIPTGIATNTFNWSFTYAGDTITSGSNTQTVAGTNFSLCGGDGGAVEFLNFTYKDESDNTKILNGTIPSSTWLYYLGSGTTNKTYSFINNTANAEYTFCATPADRNLTIDYSLQYHDQEGTYIQRLLNPAATSFSNATTNTTLYLLKSTDGIYVTFQVIDPAEQAIPNVIVTGTRVIGSETVTVASGTTDAAGAVTFFLDSDFSHTFLFESESYSDYTTSIFPTQSSYTINLGGGGSVTVDDYTQGINIQIAPPNTTLTNDTTYDFSMTVASSFWTISEFGIVLFNETGDQVASASSPTAAGTVTKTYDVGNTTDYISMNYYYVIGGNYTNGTKNWYVLSSAGTDWSINHFFTDFTNYSNSGLFGLGDFGKAIIIFLIVFMFVGIMSYKFGLVSPAGISTLTFGIVLFFDVGLNLMADFNPIGAVPHFPTIFIGLILAGTLFREVYR